MDPATPITEWAKLGIGFASFVALLRFMWWMATELKESRKDFLLGLDKRDANQAAQLQILREHNERQVRGLHESIDDLGTEIRTYANGRDKGRG